MPDAPSAGPTIEVTGPILHPSPETVATCEARTGTKRKPRRKKGGWPARTGLTRQEVENIHACAHAARKSYRGWRSFLVTLNPEAVEGESDAARKERIDQKITCLGQGLKRRGQPELRLKIWQKPPSGRLHAHVWVLTDPKNYDVLARLHHAPAIVVQEWGPDIGYVTRERLPGPPQWERLQKWKRYTGQPIRGRRLSVHPDLQSLVHEVEARDARPPQPSQPVAAEFSGTIKSPVQLDLFHALPAAMPAEFDLAAERQRLGLSQRALAGLVCLKQPHIANVERGHDRLSPARLKAVRHVLASLAVAA